MVDFISRTGRSEDSNKNPIKFVLHNEQDEKKTDTKEHTKLKR